MNKYAKITALLMLVFLSACATDNEWKALRIRQQETYDMIKASIEKQRKNQSDILNEMVKNSEAMGENNKYEYGCLTTLSEDQLSKYDQYRMPSTIARRSLAMIRFISTLNYEQKECFVKVDKERERLEKESQSLKQSFEDIRQFIMDQQLLLEKQARSMSVGP